MRPVIVRQRVDPLEPLGRLDRILGRDSVFAGRSDEPSRGKIRQGAPDGLRAGHLVSLGDRIQRCNFVCRQARRHDLHRFRTPPGSAATALLQLFDVVPGFGLGDPGRDHLLGQLVLAHVKIVNENDGDATDAV